LVLFNLFFMCLIHFILDVASKIVAISMTNTIRHIF